jgi:superkiller protein 3
VQLAVDTIAFAAKTTGSVLDTFNFWKSLGDACSVFVQVQSYLAKYPHEHIVELLGNTSQDGFAILQSIDQVNIKALEGDAVDGNAGTTSLQITRCTHAMILCYKQAIHVSTNDRHAQAVGYYNLGWAEERAHSCTSAAARYVSSKYIKAAIRAFKRAIELEAGNADFWNALGTVTSQINPSVSQHAFSRSLYINERSPVAWTNLGALGLLSGDIKFANEAFTRAQSTDPDYGHAWLGQAFVALMYGDAKEARGLFTHAMGIAEASSLPIRRHYSAAMFDHILTAPSGLNMASLIQPLFALNQVQSLRPRDFGFSHLATLLQERTRESQRAVETLEHICTNIEAEFETNESPESLAKVTLAKTDLARAYLAARSYEKAVECGEMALGLSSDDAESELQAEQRKKARLSAHLTVGLAQYYSQQFDEALQCFEAALEESNNNPDAVCLLTQVLWAQGTDDARERAREALFEVISTSPEHVESVLLLGVIALLDGDEDSLEAVVESLESLRTNDHVLASEQSHISEVLRAIAAVGAKGETEVVRNQTQTDIMLYPNLPHGWSSLAEVTGDEYSAQMALSVAARSIPPRGLLESQDLAKAFAGTGRVADAQRAVLLAPWESFGWESLKVGTQNISA